MRKIIGHALAGCAAVALAAATLVVAGSPAGARPSRAAHLFPLAGNSRYLVYSQDHAPNGSRGYTGCSHGSPTLHVRTKSGHTRTLAAPHTSSGKHYLDDADPCYGLQLNGHFLTLEGVSGGRDPMYWWDLEHHTHGKVVLPENDSRILVVGTVAGGWLFAHTNSGKQSYAATTLYRQGTSGKVTTYARLARFSLLDVATSPRGLVVGDGGHPLRYLPVGGTRARKLDAPAHRYRDTDCFALTSTYAACRSDKETDNAPHHFFDQVSITPLSGKATVASSPTFIPKDRGLLFPSTTSRGIVGLIELTRTKSELRGLGTNGRVTSAHGHGATALVVAFGKIIVGHEGGRLTSQGSVTGKQHTLLATH